MDFNIIAGSFMNIESSLSLVLAGPYTFFFNDWSQLVDIFLPVVLPCNNSEVSFGFQPV